MKLRPSAPPYCQQAQAILNDINQFSRTRENRKFYSRILRDTAQLLRNPTPDNIESYQVLAIQAQGNMASRRRMLGAAMLIFAAVIFMGISTTLTLIALNAYPAMALTTILFANSMTGKALSLVYGLAGVFSLYQGMGLFHRYGISKKMVELSEMGEESRVRMARPVQAENSLSHSRESGSLSP